MSIGKYGEMGRKRIRRYGQETRQLACGEAVRFVADEQPKDVKPCSLGESCEGAECRFRFHRSRLMESGNSVKVSLLPYC